MDNNFRTEQLGQRVGFNIIFLSQIPIFSCNLLKTFYFYIYEQRKRNPCQNDNSKPVYVGTKSPGYLLSLVDKGQPVNNSLFTSNAHYLGNGISFALKKKTKTFSSL